MTDSVANTGPANTSEDSPGGGAPPRPLDGVVVIELGIAIAAPAAARTLAYFGADVVKIESPTNPDVTRLFGSAWARDDLATLGAAFMDTGPYVTEMSAGKRNVGLDLKRPEGVVAALELVRHADVFITNYSTPAVRALGLSYEDCRAVNESIVYVSLPGFGSDPALPYYPYLAWGPNQAPLVGLDNLTGYPDQEPCGIATIAPPDYFSAYHATIAVLSGLAHRDNTGEGTWVDLSQYEATVALLGPLLMGQAIAGTAPERVGNRQPGAAPHGVYPCRGTEKWVAISVEDDAGWLGLGRAFGGPGWAGDPRFASVEGRVAHHDEIDARIASWTGGHSPEETAAWLQEQGVAAYAVLDNTETLVDPQVRDRGWFKVRTSARLGRDLMTGVAIGLSDTPGDFSRAGSMLGQDTEDVLTGLAGLAEGDVTALVEQGVAFTAHEPDLTLRRPYDGYLHVFVAEAEVRL